MLRFHLLVGALVLLLTDTAAEGVKAERVQLWHYAPEVPYSGRSAEPTVHATAWDAGDLKVQFTQAAPYGEWLAVSPVWETAGHVLVLRYTWVARYPSTPWALSLCTKHMQAWVIGVPEREYTVVFSNVVPRYSVREGHVVETSR